MEDDGGIATTVVIKARSAYTWLDKLRFLKGLLPDDSASLVNEQHQAYQCSDLESLEETCKVLFSAKEKLGRKSRKLCWATEHIFKEFKQFAGQQQQQQQQADDAKAANGRLEPAVVEEERLWTSGASDRSEEEETPLSPIPTLGQTEQQLGGTKTCSSSPLKQDGGRTSRLDSFGSEPPPARSKTVVTRNRRSVPDLSDNITAKNQKLYKFDEPRVVTQEHRQQRSGIKRRQSSEENGNTKHLQATSVPEIGVTKPSPTLVLELASDHPSKRPPESLVHITYQVFLQAGRGGLTAREAASRIEEAGLGAAFQGLVKPRIKIGKIIRNNPYYFQAGEGRYILCEAIVGVTQSTPQVLPAETNALEKPKIDSRKEAAAMARREGTARYWAQMNASGRTRVAKNRHSKPAGAASRSKMHWKSDESCVTGKDGEWTGNGNSSGNGNGNAEHPEVVVVVQPHTKPRLKGMYKTAVGGKPCKRSDGKNWQCPLMAPPNSNYCEHHQKRMTKDTTTES